MPNSKYNPENLDGLKVVSKKLSKKIAQLHEIEAVDGESTKYRSLLLSSLRKQYDVYNKDKIVAHLRDEISSYLRQLNAVL